VGLGGDRDGRLGVRAGPDEVVPHVCTAREREVRERCRAAAEAGGARHAEGAEPRGCHGVGAAEEAAEEGGAGGQQRAQRGRARLAREREQLALRGAGEARGRAGAARRQERGRGGLRGHPGRGGERGDEPAFGL
jgi:hypothetical protein